MEVMQVMLDKHALFCYYLIRIMKPNTEKKIRRLTMKQAGALKTFIIRPTATSLATIYQGRQAGGVMSGLQRNGIIGPKGREGRRMRWEVIDPDISGDVIGNRKEVIDLIDNIWGKNGKT
jgi:hypothetical protein